MAELSKQQIWWAGLSPEDKAEERRKNAERNRFRRATMTPEQREAYLAKKRNPDALKKNAERNKIARVEMTPEQREAYLAKKREAAKARWASLSQEERDDYCKKKYEKNKNNQAKKAYIKEWREKDTHKLARSSWAAMISRCDRPKSIGYQNYGGRGIKYDPRWKDFDIFLQDMGDRPEYTTIDRIDVNGNYCKDNCRWATLEEQANNNRANKIIEFNGVSQTLAQWAKQLGCDPTTITGRLMRGWSVEKALTTPPPKQS